ncbi:MULTISPECIES: ATP-binding cassette domain-containing protein [unclassified Janthinobacterium]|uniref:ATP-binding cassette domain-containing protein n=1 Tax=unclassified Janthinobacterium TaxID=2610881 RepID=UPI000685807E|nr:MULTISPECIES: ABC transporter ATP-binding protein [unclassified Janthinobacterium]MEC5160916.1 ABC-2 type transport system ATP-binding protein [Janthinobacterium sp. CG_S6]
MLHFDKLCKSFGHKHVLNNATDRLGHGVFALRGPNGIGKSTLLSMLAGIVEPDSGKIQIGPHSMRNSPLLAKACLSYVPDECPVYPFMTGREFLKFVAYAKQCQISAEVFRIAASLGLAEHLDTRISDMSLGTQKKTMLAAAWIGEPLVMLFDEPSNGLDLAAREVLIGLVKASRTSRTMLISTHDEYFISGLEARVIMFDTLFQDGLPEKHAEKRFASN